MWTSLPPGRFSRQRTRCTYSILAHHTPAFPLPCSGPSCAFPSTWTQRQEHVPTNPYAFPQHIDALILQVNRIVVCCSQPPAMHVRLHVPQHAHLFSFSVRNARGSLHSSIPSRTTVLVTTPCYPRYGLIGLPFSYRRLSYPPPRTPSSWFTASLDLTIRAVHAHHACNARIYTLRMLARTHPHTHTQQSLRPSTFHF